MRTFKLKLPLINVVTIDICEGGLADFTSRQLKNYIIKIDDTKSKIKYHVNIGVESAVISDKISAFMENDKMLSRKIFVNNHILSNINSEYKIKSGSLIIKSSKRISSIRKLYTKARSGIYSFYHTLFYELVLFPLFSLYCIYDGYFLLHGSILKLNNKYASVLGLDGVGKTSFANEIIKKGGNVLADNFILCNGKYVLPLHLAMRLDLNHETPLEVLYKDNELKEALSPVMENSPITIDDFFILSISDTFTRRKVSINIFSVYSFLNNAPEIGSANSFITPFLYMNMEKYKSDPVNVTLLGIPKGKIREGVERMLNEY